MMIIITTIIVIILINRCAKWFKLPGRGVIALMVWVDQPEPLLLALNG